MFNSLTDLSKRPFPLIETNGEKFSLSLILGLFIFVFLSVFQPFGLNKLVENKYLYFFCYGAISFFIELIFTFGLMKLFQRFYDSEQWTLGRHIINVFFLIVSLAFLNWLFTVWVVDSKYNSFAPFLIDTLAIGFFPSIFIFFYLERKLRLQNIGISEKINDSFLNISNIPATARVVKKNAILEIEGVKVQPENLLCVKSMGNYVSMCFIDNGEITREIIRTTMKQIEKTVEGNNDIVRCHKSYFVNLKKVTNSFGNARSLYLEIEGVDMHIPVSRKVAKELFSKVA